VALQSAKLDESLGELFLSNIFDQKSDQLNFIGVSHSRTDDLEDSAAASFLVNKVDQDYADVVFASDIPLFPGNNGRCCRTCLVPDMLVRKSIEHVGGGRSESAAPHRDLPFLYEMMRFRYISALARISTFLIGHLFWAQFVTFPPAYRLIPSAF
jgi:hypothetical protein